MKLGKLILIVAVAAVVGFVIWAVVSERGAPSDVSRTTARTESGEAGGTGGRETGAAEPIGTIRSVEPVDVPPSDTGDETAPPVDVADAGNDVPPADYQPPAIVPERNDPVSSEELLEKALEEVPSHLREEIRAFFPPRLLKERRKAIKLLAKKGDAHAIEVLMALGDARVYVNWAAVEALGTVYTPEVAAYLKGKLENQDSRIVCSAIQAYGRNQGDKAIAELVNVLKENRERPDGFQQEVCSITAKVMANIGSPAAVPALAGELGRYEEKGWNLEYGSVVTAALGRLGTPQGLEAITAYADGISTMIPEDPMAKEYYESKIAEARKAAAGEINDELIRLR